MATFTRAIVVAAVTIFAIVFASAALAVLAGVWNKTKRASVPQPAPQLKYTGNPAAMPRAAVADGGAAAAPGPLTQESRTMQLVHMVLNNNRDVFTVVAMSDDALGQAIAASNAKFTEGASLWLGEADYAERAQLGLPTQATALTRFFMGRPMDAYSGGGDPRAVRAWVEQETAPSGVTPDSMGGGTDDDLRRSISAGRVVHGASHFAMLGSTDSGSAPV